MSTSNTKTKQNSLSKEKFRATRPLDYIYDPLYTFSGPKDYYKTAYQSFRSSSEYSVQPIFESMFSDMLRYPRASLVLKSAHHLPSFIDTSYGGKLRAADEQSTSTADITGADRFKFSKKPTTESSSLAPSLTSRFPMLGIESITKLGTLAPPATAYIQLPSSPPRQEYLTQTKAIQTDFREVETQTKPWAPPYVTKDSDTPEILTLDRLRWGEELPPGIHTVDIIEHARMKRAWENILPPVDSVKNTNRRCRLIADLEKSTWEFRDEEIQYIKNMRLKQAEQTLTSYKNLKAEILEEKMKWITEDRYKEKRRKIKLIEHSKARALRKLSMKERGYNPKYQKMNITNELDDHASQVYAPFQRWGTNFRNKHEVITSTDGIKIDYTNRETYLLDNSKPYQHKFDFNKASQPRKQVDLCFRETRWTEENLDKLHADLKAIRLKDDIVLEKRPFTMLEKIPKPPKPREIPSVKEDTDWRVNNAAMILQKVIKGRALQFELFKERNRWHELIEELKRTNSVEEDPQSNLEQCKNGLLKLILDERRRHLQQICEPQGLDSIMAQDIGDVINFLSREQIHFKDEKDVHDLVLDIEHERWRREAAESGRRQKEIQRRREHEEIYNKVAQIHEKTANSFTSYVSKEARTSTAEIEAEKLVQEFADISDAAAYNAYLRNNEREKEMIATELLYNFVLPESNKAIIRQRMHERNQKCLLAIHDQIFDTIKKEKLAEIPKFAADLVDNIISEAVNKLCYKIADDLIQTILDNAFTIIQDHVDTTPDDYVIEELLKVICKGSEHQNLYDSSSRPPSSACRHNSVCLDNGEETDENKCKQNLNSLLNNHLGTSTADDYVIEELLKAICNISEDKNHYESLNRPPSSDHLGTSTADDYVIEELLKAIFNSYEKKYPYGRLCRPPSSDTLENETEEISNPSLLHLELEKDETI